MSGSVDITPELLQGFLDEAPEYLQKLEEGLIALEDIAGSGALSLHDPADQARMNTIFRAAHSLKGLAAAFGFDRIKHLTHRMETLFDKVRTRERDFSAESFEALFHGVDRLKALVTELSDASTGPTTIDDVLAELDRVLAASVIATTVGGATADASAPSFDTFPNGVLSDSGLASLFVAASSESLDELSQGLLELEKTPSDRELLNTVFRCTHNIKGASAAAGLTGMNRLTHDMESVLGQLQRGLIALNDELMDGLFRSVDRLKFAVERVRAGHIDDLSPGDPGLAANVAHGASPESAEGTAPPTPVATAAAPRHGASSPPSPLPTPSAPASQTRPIRAGETLRVAQDRLDHLANLGGELVANLARFAQIHRRFQEAFGRDDSACLLDNMSDFDEALQSLTRITEAIRQGIVGMRTAPLGSLFTRFRRVVRDIAKSHGKPVELVLHGENIEIDKRVVDELADPLTHMIRNSVDHGLESPAYRIAAGKCPAGTVMLEASRRGRNLCIEVKDDGAGINLERVRQKIVEREMASPAQVEKMGDRELISYICKPGFSTAPALTDLSGRGMGMDIVLDKIERLGGTVEIRSVEGRGTHITIELPLTPTILRCLVVRIGDGLYAIPLENVAKIITTKQSDVHSIHLRRVVWVGEKMIPLLTLEDALRTNIPGLRTVSRDHEEQTIVVVGFDHEKLGLVVDSLEGQEDVAIQSIAEHHRNLRGLAGTSMRRDGTVSQILDVGAMLDLADESATDHAPTKPPAAGAER